eukprot:scaffold2632_cov384-Pavlova_lutheri.AAC.1
MIEHRSTRYHGVVVGATPHIVILRPRNGRNARLWLASRLFEPPSYLVVEPSNILEGVSRDSTTFMDKRNICATSLRRSLVRPNLYEAYVQASLLVNSTFFWRSTIALHDIPLEEQRGCLSPMGSC